MPQGGECREKRLVEQDRRDIGRQNFEDQSKHNSSRSERRTIQIFISPELDPKAHNPCKPLSDYLIHHRTILLLRNRRIPRPN
jgi:hypothetical protein